MAIKPGYKQTEVGVIPEDWEIHSLKNIADPYQRWSFTGGPFGSNLKSSDYTDTGVRIIQLQNIGDGDFKSNYEIYTSEQKANELASCNIYPGEIILSKMGDPVARACIIPSLHERYVMCSDGIRLAVDKNRFSPYFVYTQINAPAFRSKAANAGTGSTRKRIGLTELKALELCCPPLPEQQAIAHALITALGQLIHKQRQIKQGAMQELLTGKRRLPGFTGEWEVRRLGDVCYMKSGIGITDSDIDEYSEFPCYGGNGRRGFSKKYTHNGYYALIGRQGALCGNVLNVSGRFFASEHAIVVTNHKETSINWLSYVLSRMNLNQYSESSAQPGLSVSKLLILECKIPTLPEQTAIAAILSDMDAEITALEAKLAKARQVKQGMMQELLTGRIRLL